MAARDLPNPNRVAVREKAGGRLFLLIKLKRVKRMPLNAITEKGDHYCSSTLNVAKR